MGVGLTRFLKQIPVHSCIFSYEIIADENETIRIALTSDIVIAVFDRSDKRSFEYLMNILAKLYQNRYFTIQLSSLSKKMELDKYRRCNH